MRGKACSRPHHVRRRMCRARSVEAVTVQHTAARIALHCIALHCIALHCIALHCIARCQRSTVQHPQAAAPAHRMARSMHGTGVLRSTLSAGLSWIECVRRMRPTGAVARGNPACSLGWAGLAREGKGARSQTHGHGSESRGTSSSRSRPAPASLARAHAALSHAPTARLVRRAAPPAEQRALRATRWGDACGAGFKCLREGAVQCAQVEGHALAVHVHAPVSCHARAQNAARVATVPSGRWSIRGKKHV
jgi:hypothetical protein